LEDIDADPYSCLIALLFDTVTTVSAGNVAGMLAVVVLFIISAFVSGSEVAFFSLSPSQLSNIRSNASPADNLIMKLLEKPKRLLASILITNNFVNVAIIILSSYLFRSFLSLHENPLLSFILEVIVITFLILIFGEILPKIYASQKAEKFALFMAGPLHFLVRLLHPISTLLVKSTSIVDKRMAKKGQNISMSDLSEAIDITSDNTTMEEDKKLLKGIVNFADIEVSEVMKSRVDVTPVDSKTPFGELVNIVIEIGRAHV